MINTAEEKKKLIDGFRIHFKQGLDKKGERAFLTLTFNSSLRAILKEVCINETTEDKFNQGRINNEGSNQYQTYERYKVKSIIYNSIYQTDKGLLFNKQLLNKGSLKLEFYNFIELETIKTRIKEGIQRALRVILNTDFEQTINFKQLREIF